MMPNIVVYGSVTLFDLLLVVAIIVIAVFVSKWVAISLRRSLKDKVGREHLEIIRKIVSYSIIVIAITWALTILGVNLSGLMVAGGIAGLVIGFASQSIVGNLVSGLFLMIERPIKIGDQVDIDQIRGFVEDIRIISTTVRTYDGLYVRIPNQKVFTTSITNYVGNVARRFGYVVGIQYSDDADQAINIIKNLIEAYPFALKNPPPQAFVDNLGDNSVNIIVRVWAPITDWYALKMELLWKIKKALEEEGIEIAFPQRVVWFANEFKRQNIEKHKPSGNNSP